MQLKNAFNRLYQLSLIKKISLICIVAIGIVAFNYITLVRPELARLTPVLKQQACLQSQYKIRYALLRRAREIKKLKKHLGLRLKSKLNHYVQARKPFAWVEQLIKNTRQSGLKISNLQPLKAKQDAGTYFEPIKISLRGQFVPLLRWLIQQNRSPLVVKFIAIQIKRLKLAHMLAMGVTFNVYANQ